MNIHEHQAKKILKDYGAPVSNGVVILRPDEITSKIKELKSGNIEGSKNVPFMELINEKDNTFKDKRELGLVFEKLQLDTNKHKAFTCGSGVTACILGLANSIISGKNPVIYDGSWSEYGLK